MTGRTDNTGGVNGRGMPRLRRDSGGTGGGTGWDNLPPANPSPTGEEFDALTDLFLGEVDSGVKPAAERVSADSHAPARNGRAKPVLRLAGVEEELEMEEPGVAAVAPAMVEAKAEPQRAGGAGIDAIVECVVLGHLPVLAAAWGAQYVREVAQASGRPVAYLRLQHGYASIELIGGDGEREEMPSAKTIEEGLRLAAERTRRWVVRADVGDETKLAASPLVRVVTLLTGVDEAAVVAAYGSVKSLAASLSATGAEGPLLRVAAMGAAPDRAMTAGKRLADAITRFVGRDVETAVCGARIASARPSEVVFTGRTEIAPGEAMDLLARIASETDVRERPAVVRAAERPRPVLRAPERGVELEIEPSLEEELDAMLGTPDGVSVVAAAEASRAVDIPPPPREPARLGAAEDKLRPVTAQRAEPVRRPEPAFVAAVSVEEESGADAERAEVLADAPSALALLLPGLRPVSVRCPYAEAIEFAVDRSGAVHLLSRIEDGAEERALSELLVAGAWADAHASMLAATLGQSAGMVASGLSERAELHLFTDRPKASRRLLETSVNVHLLARVEVGGQSGWYCTDLN